MGRKSDHCYADVEATFKIYHELMSFKVREILLVLTEYDAYIMEGDGSLTSRIVNQYHGLNLSHPPRMTLATSASEALSLVSKNHFDLVITMPQIGDMDGFSLSQEIKKFDNSIPVIMLAHSMAGIFQEWNNSLWKAIESFYIWSSDPDLLTAIVKNIEDHSNVDLDTRKGDVRVILLVEDSPLYRSFFLPLIYKEIVQQTQAIMDESINEEHRLLKMRARPKILTASDYHEAMDLFDLYEPYISGVMSDTRFMRHGEFDDQAGISFLTHVRKNVPDLPLLLLSSEASNLKKAASIPAFFVDKNSVDLAQQINRFFRYQLGFGHFKFRMEDGTLIDQAVNLIDFEKKIHTIPTASLLYHAERNHFFTWVMARTEVLLAKRLHKNSMPSFAHPEDLRTFLSTAVRDTLKRRQMGVITQFNANFFDAEIMDFVKVGNGAIGGKAMGLAFIAEQMRKTKAFCQHTEITVSTPKTTVITTDGFDAFVEHNKFNKIADFGDDQAINQLFLDGEMPDWLTEQLDLLLKQAKHPIIVRSSSVLEDAHYAPYAGLFTTYAIPNSHTNQKVRLAQLEAAITLVYASAFHKGPRTFSRSSGQQHLSGSMAVMVQQLIGHHYGDYFYPAISGVLQSYNYYPIEPMEPEDGIASIALGLGKTVVEGEKCLSFCPKHPQVLPQFSTVEDILNNSQGYFYALDTSSEKEELNFDEHANLIRRTLNEAQNEYPLQILTSIYSPEDHRIRDQAGAGHKILTFSQLTKYNLFPLAEVLQELVALGKQGIGCSAEIEFTVDIGDGTKPPCFYILQVRPMAVGCEQYDVKITDQELNESFCYSDRALGHGSLDSMRDIVYVKPASFSIDNTHKIAKEISKINNILQKEKSPYLLIGPGRWGSTDPFLGIPVRWQDINGVRAMMELRNKQLKVDPSQGTHFFQNITSTGVFYITVEEETSHYLKWEFLEKQPVIQETDYLRHIRFPKPYKIKVDNRSSQCIIF